MKIQFDALPEGDVLRIRSTGTDCYGNPVERHVSDGQVFPCRSCLGTIPAGQTYLILAHRPFASTNPYAETGPIFLCDDCTPATSGPGVPEILTAPDYILRAYSQDERILYGTGQVTPTGQIARYAASLLERPEVAFVDIRSARNNCYQCRVRRAS